MSDIYHGIAEIIANTVGIGADQIRPDINVISDLGIDSIDFLDATYDIDRRFSIKLPIEEWMESVNSGESSLEKYFVMQNFVNHVNELIAHTK